MNTLKMQIEIQQIEKVEYYIYLGQQIFPCDPSKESEIKEE